MPEKRIERLDPALDRIMLDAPGAPSLAVDRDLRQEPELLQPAKPATQDLAVQADGAGGAIAGGLIGAGTGAAVGNAVTAPPSGQCARWGYDYNGNRVCVAFY